MSEIELHPENAPRLMLVTLLGTLTRVILLRPSKAYDPIEVTFEGIMISPSSPLNLLIDEHPEKDLPPISMRFVGVMTDVIFVQLAKEYELIESKAEGRLNSPSVSLFRLLSDVQL